MVEQYKSLSDATVQKGCEGLDVGRTEIWYMKREAFRKWNMGPLFADAPLPTPTTTDLSKDHVLLGWIKEKQLGPIFEMLQGEMWSPGGEANSFIRSKGTAHTSMSVGDIIVVGGKGWMVDGSGFAELPKDKREAQAMFQAAQEQSTALRAKYRNEDVGSMRGLLRQLEEGGEAVAFGWYKPAEVYQALVDAYLKVHSLKADFDRMEEIPQSLMPAYNAVMKAADAIMQAQKASNGLSDQMRAAYKKFQR
jgi:tRNA A-37 threonylcarbamoyl transferase component Bud32